MITVVAIVLLMGVPQSDQRVPVTVRVKQRVEVIRGKGCMERDKLCLDDTTSKPFTIEKGETFEMIEELQEGNCRIRFKKREVEISDCWWRQGFRDQRLDIYEVIPKKSAGKPR